MNRRTPEASAVAVRARQDALLARGLHSHYCNLCDGDWDHEDRCVEGVAAWCPWCSPEIYASPRPGARRGPHFHYCPACGHSWRHAAACRAPLQAALPDCTGCRPPLAERDRRPLRASLTAVKRVGAAMLLSAATIVIVALSTLLWGSSPPWSPAFDHGAPVHEPAQDGPATAEIPPALPPIQAVQKAPPTPPRFAGGSRPAPPPMATDVRALPPRSSSTEDARELPSASPAAAAPTPSESGARTTPEETAVPPRS